MDFNYSEEQIGLRDTLNRFIERDYRFDQRRTLSHSDDGFSRSAWAQYADFGILALPFPEEFDGLGGNGIDTMLVMEAFGRGLLLEPYLSSVIVAGGLIRDSASATQKTALLPEIGTGNVMLALAAYEARSRYALNRVATTATPNGDGWIISGHKAVVMHAQSADKLLVSARTAGAVGDSSGISIFLVDAKAPGVTVTGYVTQDGSRAAEVGLQDVHVSADALVGELHQGLAALERAVDHGIGALCAEAVGIMDALNQATLEYLKTRKQFGVPIGKFQALQHRMADMVIATEQARSMATLAAVTLGSDDIAERSRVVSAAKAYIGQQLRLVGQQAVQMHGGMGVTDELNVSHYFKRLTAINATFGDADFHLGRFSATLLAA